MVVPPLGSVPISGIGMNGEVRTSHKYYGVVSDAGASAAAAAAVSASVTTATSVSTEGPMRDGRTTTPALIAQIERAAPPDRRRIGSHAFAVIASGARQP